MSYCVNQPIKKHLERRRDFLRRFASARFPRFGGLSESIRLIGLKDSERIVVNPKYKSPRAWLVVHRLFQDDHFVRRFPPEQLLDVAVDHEIGHWVFARMTSRLRREWLRERVLSLQSTEGRVTFRNPGRDEEMFAWCRAVWLNGLADKLPPAEADFINALLRAA